MSRILKNTDEWYIKNAIDAVEDKRVGLPSFQRGDVWAYRKILDLLHSVCVGIPMGAMMAWDVAHADIQNVRDLGPAGIAGGPWVEPPLSYPERLEWLLIDGQQRTTALYRAFTPVKPRDYYIDLHALRAGEDLRECLKSAKHSKSGRDREYHLACQDSSAYTEHARLGILPFPVFLGRGGYQSWAYPAAQEFAQVTGDASWDEYLRMEITEPGGICDNVSQYKINIEVLNSETSLETLCQVFVAINTSAQDLNMFEIKVADLRADAEPFMLKEEWKAARQRHGHFDRYRVAGIDILKSLALLRSAETKGIESASSSDEWVMRLDSKFVRKHWRKLLDAYVSVLD
ncbi:MAG: DUF262 domain-containing protein, partial [Actinobacteria bacterium]|nr:DUF262 domain-containing protein [Actinomycetota bacterium]